MLTTPFAEQAAIAVGNQLRIANAKFDAAIHEHRPVTFFEEIVQGLDALCGIQPELRRKR